MRYTAGVVVREEIEFKPGELRCPSCLSKDLAPSLARGWRDAFMRSLNRIPRHCRACGKRFYVRKRKTGASADAAE
jgi:DNA-directed RNA polymerase subunit RPC12/RpoP